MDLGFILGVGNFGRDDGRWAGLGFARSAFLVPHFVDLLSAAKKRLQFCPYKEQISTPKNVVFGKKLILTIRAVMLGEHVDLVAGDFNGAAWRRDNSNNISIIEEAFAECAVPTPPGHTPLLLPGSIPGCWADVCGFLKPPESDQHWKVRPHDAFSIPPKALGLRPPDQSCHHETCLHLEFVDWRSAQSHHEGHDRRILLKERPAPYHCSKQKGHMSEDVSDHSLSSDIATIRTRLTVPCGTCTSSPSDLVTLPFQVISTHASVPFFA